jgi:hypothetical protein
MFFQERFQMQNLWAFGQTMGRKLLVLALVTLLNLSGLFGLFAAPSYAINSDRLNQEEQRDRAYDGFGPDAGIEEEVYQQRLREGQDPEKMPKPYKRIESLSNRKEVPQTSAVETAVSKTRELLEDVTGK